MSHIGSPCCCCPDCGSAYCNSAGQNHTNLLEWTDIAIENRVILFSNPVIFDDCQNYNLPSTAYSHYILLTNDGITYTRPRGDYDGLEITIILESNIINNIIIEDTLNNWKLYFKKYVTENVSCPNESYQNSIENGLIFCLDNSQNNVLRSEICGTPKITVLCYPMIAGGQLIHVEDLQNTISYTVSLSGSVAECSTLNANEYNRSGNLPLFGVGGYDNLIFGIAYQDGNISNPFDNFGIRFTLDAQKYQGTHTNCTVTNGYEYINTKMFETEINNTTGEETSNCCGISYQEVKILDFAAVHESNLTDPIFIDGNISFSGSFTVYDSGNDLTINCQTCTEIPALDEADCNNQNGSWVDGCCYTIDHNPPESGTNTNITGTFTVG